MMELQQLFERSMRQVQRATPEEVPELWKQTENIKVFNRLFLANTNRYPKTNEGTWLMRHEYYDLVGLSRAKDNGWDEDSVSNYFVDVFTSIVWVLDPSQHAHYWWSGIRIEDDAAGNILYGPQFADNEARVMPSIGALWKGPYDEDDFMVKDRKLFDPMNTNSDFIRKNMAPPIAINRHYLKLLAQAIRIIRKECSSSGRRDLVKRIDEGRRLSAHARAQMQRQQQMVRFGEDAVSYMGEAERLSLALGPNLVGPFAGLSTEELVRGFLWVKEAGEAKLKLHRFLSFEKAVRAFSKDNQLRTLLKEVLAQLRKEGRLLNSSDLDAGLSGPPPELVKSGLQELGLHS